MNAIFDIGPRTAAEFEDDWFCRVLEERHPEERTRRAAKSKFYWQRALPSLSLVVTMYVAPDNDRCGLFFGRNEKLGAIDVVERLQRHAARLCEILKLDPAVSSTEFPFMSEWQVNCFAADNWPAMTDWLTTEATFSNAC
ncbi:hypothetical protein [Mesorhizobium carmichaelinearum]|uniref:hypothetical protein n=1 Tax=Mesorhizobium carmichaelinearum TaxID=1208188 RepID=UPI000BA3CC65|nr:hypothetical protein [Mesorhizobium carmichaelinearum]